MAVRNIVKIGSATLRKKSKPVVSFDESLHTLLDDMKNTMIEKMVLVLLPFKWVF